MGQVLHGSAKTAHATPTLPRPHRGGGVCPILDFPSSVGERGRGSDLPKAASMDTQRRELRDLRERETLDQLHYSTS